MRLDFARVLTPTQPAIALVEARTALQRFQHMAATRDADAATSLLRRLGVRGHKPLTGDTSQLCWRVP